MEEKVQSLQYRTKANDVDEKGIVTVAVNGIGVKDSQNDISMPGSFNKTLSENISRMKWFLNHRTDQLLGVPLSGVEKDGNLEMTGQLNLQKQIGRDTLSDYKLYAENGRTLEHSIGVKAIKRDTADPRRVLEWKMYEYSTLTSWGSNPQTFLVNIKSATRDQVKDAIDFINKAFREKGYSEERLKNYNMELDLLLKSMNGGTIVTCPCCGHQFDYDEQNEVTFQQQVLQLAAQYQRWITDNTVRQEMDKLKPEIQEQVMAVINACKAANMDYSEKSIQDIMAYVRCPNCWERVYRTNTLLINTDEPSDDTQEKGGCEADKDNEKEKAGETTFDLKSINEKVFG